MVPRVGLMRTLKELPLVLVRTPLLLAHVAPSAGLAPTLKGAAAAAGAPSAGLAPKLKGAAAAPPSAGGAPRVPAAGCPHACTAALAAAASGAAPPPNPPKAGAAAGAAPAIRHKRSTGEMRISRPHLCEGFARAATIAHTGHTPPQLALPCHCFPCYRMSPVTSLCWQT